MEGVATYMAIAWSAPIFERLGIVGKDMHKKGQPTIPEAMGLVAGIILLTCLHKDFTFGPTLVGLCIGALDDIIDLRWRYKILFSAAGYILLMADDNTSVSLFGQYLELGYVYHVYMVLWCIWCGNSINIYAGINGIEVGQTLVIAIGLLSFCSAKSALISYIFVAGALLYHNRYPASVFVGDSWCYLSGMFFVAVARHETEQLALIMCPQIVNTVLSLPELIGYLDCPRHRMPHYNPDTDKLYHSGYGTFMNVILWVCGPMHERQLFYVLMALQSMAVVCAIILFA